MKNKLGFLFLLILLTQSIIAQEKIYNSNTIITEITIQKKQDLFILGKIWGFLKYFHPQVASGKFDWDNELINFIPSYLHFTSRKEKNDSLLAWINRLGDVPILNTGNYDTVKNVKIRPDFSWISTKNFSEALVTKLKYILANRKQGDQYYIKFEHGEGLNIPVFLNEKSYSNNKYPEVEIRILALFRFWNNIEYWYPYKYNLSQSWDKTLKQYISPIVSVKDALEYTKQIQKLLARIGDGHGYVRSITTNNLQGNLRRPFIVRYVENKLIIAAITNDSIAKQKSFYIGDVIERVDAVNTSDYINEKLQYVSASTKSDALLTFCRDFRNTKNDSTLLRISHNGISKNILLNNILDKKYVNPYTPIFSYQRDSSLCMLKYNILYLNVGRFNIKDSNLLIKSMAEAKSLIIDSRQNALESLHQENPLAIINKLISTGKSSYKFSTVKMNFPGLFKIVDSTSVKLKPEKFNQIFNKPIAILINEETKSVGEFMSMIFSVAPKTILVGTHTAGADGSAYTIVLPGNLYIQYTHIGIYWADGRETQRMGILPDLKVTPTIEGYKKRTDEILEKAIEYLSNKK